jgi:hypothetical protein
VEFGEGKKEARKNGRIKKIVEIHDKLYLEKTQ